MTRLGVRVGAVLLCGAAAAGIYSGTQAVAGPGPVSRPAAVHVVPAANSGTGAGGAAKSHTVAKAVAGHLVYHLMPHAHIPYVFRPRIFRRPRLLRGY